MTLKAACIASQVHRRHGEAITNVDRTWITATFVSTACNASATPLLSVLNFLSAFVTVNGPGKRETAPQPASNQVAAATVKLLDWMRQAIRIRHYSYRTEEAYIGWIRPG